MTHQNHCPTCQSPLPEGTPPGRCPQCLLRAAAHQTSASRIGKSTFTPPTPNELDAALHGFEVLSLVGQGGMGAVYKAIHLRLDRVVAIKVLPKELETSDPTFGERFLREARSLAKLQHPNLVVVHDFGEVDGLYFIVMEYVEGANLRERLRDGSLKPEAALKILPQICEGLRYAHGQGLVHRDIKPENILLGDDGRVRIADFGLARMVHPDASDISLTGTEQALGTPHYMAPEQLRDPERVDHRADLFSLGVVFYEMLTGNLPQGRFPLPSEEVEVGKYVDDVVLKSLEPNPERRYQQAEDMEEDLERSAGSSGGDADAQEGDAKSQTIRDEDPVTSEAVPGVPAADPAHAPQGWDIKEPLQRKAFITAVLITLVSFLPWWTITVPYGGLKISGTPSNGHFDLEVVDLPIWLIPTISLGLAVAVLLGATRRTSWNALLLRRVSLAALLLCAYGLIGSSFSWIKHLSGAMEGEPYATPGIAVIVCTLLFFRLWFLLGKTMHQGGPIAAQHRVPDQVPTVPTEPKGGRKRAPGEGPVTAIHPAWMKAFGGGIAIVIASLFPWGKVVMESTGFTASWKLWSGSIDILFLEIPLGALFGAGLLIAIMAGLRIHEAVQVPPAYPRRTSLAAGLVCVYGLGSCLISWMGGNNSSMEAPRLDIGAGGVAPDQLNQVMQTAVDMWGGYVIPGVGLLVNTFLFLWIWWVLRKAK